VEALDREMIVYTKEELNDIVDSVPKIYFDPEMKVFRALTVEGKQLHTASNNFYVTSILMHAQT
jgi:hypothetical protein